LSKIVIIKTTNAIFLFILLVGGTFVTIFPLSFIIEIQAQTAESEYRNNNNYNAEYYPQEYEFNDGYMQNDSYPDIVVPIDFSTIQDAIDAADEGDVIKVLTGTYTEQLNIAKSLTIIGSGAKSTIIEAPQPLEDLDTNVIGRPYIVEVNNEAEVTMKGFTIKGLEDPNCNILFGVTVLGDATLKLDSAVIRDCNFAGIVVGISLTSDNSQTGHATITNTVITDYQKFGVYADGSGSTLTMSYNNIVASNYEGFDTVEVEIPPNLIGIYFTNDAQATITHNKVSGNICTLPEICGPDWFTQFQAAGIGFCNKSFISSTTSDDSPINTQQENFNIPQFCPVINGTIPNDLFIASEIDVQQENSNELDSSLMPIQTIHNHINTNVAVNAAGPDSSIISNNYVSNNDVGISITGEQSGCCIIDYNKLTDNRFFGIVIADGEHKVSNTKIFGGEVGVAAIATNANTTATLDNVKIVDAEIPEGSTFKR
jgi:nitrous oxidase accessory protein NosD